VAKHSQHYWQASLENRDGDLSRDLVLVYQLERPHTGLDLVTSKHPGEDGYFLLTLTAGKELEGATGGCDYVFVLDVSGSMEHDGKLAMSRGSIERFIEALDDGDGFELITFNISSQAMFGALKPATAESKTQAAEFLRSQRAVGGTVLRPAIEAAYRYRQEDRPLNVVVLSDGMTEQREQAELVQLMAQRPQGVTVFCVGVGNEVNRPLLTQLAHDAGGLAAFVSADDDFQRQAQAFRRKLTRPAAKDVKIAFNGGEVYDLEPPTLPNLFYGQPIRLYGRYRASGPAKVHITAEVLGSPLDQTIEVSLPASDEANPQIDRMWASHRVARLMDENRSAGTNSHADEIVRLCEGYSIVSEYASFIVLENDAEYKRWQIERRNVTRVERDRAAQLALRTKLDQLRQQAAAQLGPAADSQAASSATTTSPTGTGPAADSSANFTGATPSPAPVAPPQQASRGWDISMPSGGGGAIDPVTALLAAGLAGLGFAARRGKQGRKNNA
jgi:Ca-activated chloride channel family protein